MSQNKWTKMDKQLLYRHYATMAPGDLMRLLPGRRWVTIGRKARELGLRRATRMNPMGGPPQARKT